MKIKKLINWLPKVGYFVNVDRVKNDDGTSISTKGGGEDLSVVGVYGVIDAKKGGDTKVQGDPSSTEPTVGVKVSAAAAMKVRNAVLNAIKGVTDTSPQYISMPSVSFILITTIYTTTTFAKFPLSDFYLNTSSDEPYINALTFRMVQDTSDDPTKPALAETTITFTYDSLGLQSITCNNDAIPFVIDDDIE